ncbi:MAG: MFS transporter [Nitrososphaerota archaeon]|nr:MFS transporter [Nitrososphaerota archaeon]MDG6950783.1 MFS transporter [Nitrososphaerota archaeon]
MSRSHLKVLALSGAGVFMDGYDLFIISVALLLIKPAFDAGSLAIAEISSAALLGAVFGAVFFGNLADRLGRKRLYIIDLVFFVVFAGASAFAQNIWELVLFRFLLGIGIGADYPISASYIAEFVSNKHRGKLIASVFAFQGLGILSAVAISILLIPFGPDSWRWMLLSGVFPAVIALTARTGMPETPRWYLSHGKEEEARKVMFGFFGYQVPAERLEAVTEKVSIRELLLSPYARRVFFTSASWFLVDVGVYGIGILTPTLIHSIYGNSTPILASAITTGELYVFAGFGYLCAIALVDFVGRKPLQIIGFLGMAIPLLAAALLRTPSLIVLVPLFGLFYVFENMGPNTTTWIYPVELFPTRLRGTGHGIAATVGKVGAVVATFFLPLVLLSVGQAEMLYIVSGACLLGAGLTLYMGTETKRISLEDVSEIFKGFYDTFDKISANLETAASVLHNKVSNQSGQVTEADIQGLAVSIKGFEHAGDEMVHAAFIMLDKKFLAPIDRDDITRLLKTLDDTLDFIDASVSRMSIYHLSSFSPEIVRFTEIILGQAREIRRAIVSLKGANAPLTIDSAAIKIHELENDADDLLHSCLANLFSETEPLAMFDLIKQKEIYEYLETTTDKAEDVADVLRSLLLKYSL